MPLHVTLRLHLSANGYTAFSICHLHVKLQTCIRKVLGLNLVTMPASFTASPCEQRVSALKQTLPRPFKPFLNHSRSSSHFIRSYTTGMNGWYSYFVFEDSDSNPDYTHSPFTWLSSLSSSRCYNSTHLKILHDHFLPHTFQLIRHNHRTFDAIKFTQLKNGSLN
jgi:hypothetical protein